MSIALIFNLKLTYAIYLITTAYFMYCSDLVQVIYYLALKKGVLIDGLLKLAHSLWASNFF